MRPVNPKQRRTEPMNLLLRCGAGKQTIRPGHVLLFLSLNKLEEIVTISGGNTFASESGKY